MKIMLWRFCYAGSGVLHFCGVFLVRVAERCDKKLTDTFRKMW